MTTHSVKQAVVLFQKAQERNVFHPTTDTVRDASFSCWQLLVMIASLISIEQSIYDDVHTMLYTKAPMHTSGK